MTKNSAPTAQLGITYRIDGERHDAVITVVADGRTRHITDALSALHDGRPFTYDDVVSVGPAARS